MIKLIHFDTRTVCLNCTLQPMRLHIPQNHFFLPSYRSVFFTTVSLDNTFPLFSLQASPMNLKTSLLLANKYTPNPQYFTCSSPEVPILLRDSLVFLHDIGEGCFGNVYKGKRINRMYFKNSPTSMKFVDLLELELTPKNLAVTKLYYF